ncbi:MAG: rRNA maturation RNase YbeY [Lachnospiraceae bacterium]|nr:rRNA maturation RNase YbeY [Lachnospiraceae bacterium]
MTFFVDNETEADFGFDASELIRTVCERTFLSEGAPTECSCVNIVITDSEGIRELNASYRGIDSPTDVLSFPGLDFDKPSDFDIPDDRKADCIDPESGELILGDIVLNADRIFSQAKEYGHSVKREMAFLTAHSCLHLCGYDHMTEDEEKVMFSKQEAVLESLGITRGN